MSNNIKEKKEERIIDEDIKAYQLSQEDIKKLNIYQKMDLVRVFIKPIEKDITINNSYKAISESTIMRAVNQAEHKARLISYQSALDIVDSQIFEGQRGKVFYIRLKSTITVVNEDNPDERVQLIGYGDGIDNGDKACGKATTYASKYAILRGYKIPTGEDPDYFSSELNPIGKVIKNLASESQIKEYINLIGEENIAKACQIMKISKLEELTADEIALKIEQIKKRKEMSNGN